MGISLHHLLEHSVATYKVAIVCTYTGRTERCARTHTHTHTRDALLNTCHQVEVPTERREWSQGTADRAVHKRCIRYKAKTKPIHKFNKRNIHAIIEQFCHDWIQLVTFEKDTFCVPPFISKGDAPVCDVNMQSHFFKDPKYFPEKLGPSPLFSTQPIS